jgi:antitoxin HicB
MTMTQPFDYPATIVQDEAGFYLVTFPDVPEAGTDGRTLDEGLAEAQDALVAALGGYINERRDLPKPSRIRKGQVVVSLPPLVAAKLALYRAMREVGISKVALGKRLGVSEAAIRRLLDLDHRSHIE